MQISGSFGGFFSILLLDKIYRWSFEIKKTSFLRDSLETFLYFGELTKIH